MLKSSSTLHFSDLSESLVNNWLGPHPILSLTRPSVGVGTRSNLDVSPVHVFRGLPTTEKYRWWKLKRHFKDYDPDSTDNKSSRLSVLPLELRFDPYLFSLLSEFVLLRDRGTVGKRGSYRPR